MDPLQRASNQGTGQIYKIIELFQNLQDAFIHKWAQIYQPYMVLVSHKRKQA